jgi:hypothetical protein
VIQRWRRRTGVIYRPGTIFADGRPRTGWFGARWWSIDGGDDAPLSRRGRLIFRVTLTMVVAAGVVLIFASRPG